MSFSGIAAAARSAQPQILLVEDEILIRLNLADQLRDAGMNVVEAATADEAWRYIKSGGRVDLIFSDVQMPGSMDGVGLARRVKVEHPEFKVILTSGTRTDGIQGLAVFMPKPSMPSAVVSIIREILGGHD